MFTVPLFCLSHPLYLLLSHIYFIGCLVRLVKRWENKQFDGVVASFSRLKLIHAGHRRDATYRLRIVWWSIAALSNGGQSHYRVAQIVTKQSFSVMAHTKYSRDHRQQQSSIDDSTALNNANNKNISSHNNKRLCTRNATNLPPHAILFEPALLVALDHVQTTSQEIPTASVSPPPLPPAVFYEHCSKSIYEPLVDENHELNHIVNNNYNYAMQQQSNANATTHGLQTDDDNSGDLCDRELGILLSLSSPLPLLFSSTQCNIANAVPMLSNNIWHYY